MPAQRPAYAAAIFRPMIDMHRKINDKTVMIATSGPRIAAWIAASSHQVVRQKPNERMAALAEATCH